MSIVIALTKPIQAHGTSVDSLTLREPTPEDVMQIGVPQLLIPSADGTSVGIEVRANVVGGYISRLASIPPSSVKQMSLPDFMRCQSVVMGFFNNGGGES